MNSNNDLLFDYITGNEISEETLEKIENSEKFMKAVIKLTNDKKMYMHCSDKLKGTYSFAKFVIEKFSDDIDFIISVAEELKLNGTPTDIEKLELIVLLGNLFDKTKSDDLMGYKLESNRLFDIFLQKIDRFFDENDNDDELEDYGFGFVFIMDNFGESKVIMEMFAKKMLEEIIYDTEYGLEAIAHGTFSEKEQLEEYGAKNFILDYLGSLDVCLQEYVSNNLHLIEIAEKKVKKIQRNWKHYEENLMLNKTELTFDEYDKYCEEHDLEKIELFKHLRDIITKLGLMKTFKKYAKSEVTLMEECSKDEDEIDLNIDDITKHNFIKYMTAYITELFSRTNLKEEEEFIEEKIKPKTKTKIINYDFKNKKIISITE